MARDFNGTSDDLLFNGTTPVAGPPGTLAAWIKPDAVAAEQHIVGCTSTSSSTPIFRIGVNSNATAFTQHRHDSGNESKESGTTSVPTSSYTHICGVLEAGSLNTKLFFNGAQEGAGRTLTDSAISLTTTSIAVFNRTSKSQYFNGSIAEAAIWAAALTAAEILSLSKGMSPMLIRPDSLVMYVPMINVAQDITGTVPLVLSGSTVITHPTIQSPGTQILYLPLVAAGGTNPHGPLGHPLTGAFGGPI